MTGGAVGKLCDSFSTYDTALQLNAYLPLLCAMAVAVAAGFVGFATECPIPAEHKVKVPKVVRTTTLTFRFHFRAVNHQRLICLHAPACTTVHRRSRGRHRPVRHRKLLHELRDFQILQRDGWLEWGFG